MKNDRRRPARPARAGGGRPAPKKGAQKQNTPKKKPGKRFDEPKSAREEPRIFRLGVIPGATPGKWVDAWKTRMPHVEIELVPLTVAEQRASLDDGRVDAAITRQPIERAGDLHVIPLYEELPVVVASVESHLMAAEELTRDDLAGEVLITPGDDVLGDLDLPTTAPKFPQLATTEDAIATAASGVGIVVVPMSLARLHHRKDADYRLLVAGPVSPVALAWRREATTPDVETFVGIVRGRTANSSR